jgi:hypothetical protein
VGVPNWRDAGKIAHALGPQVTTLCLNPDCRQFSFSEPPSHHIGADVLILAPEHGDRVPQDLGKAFDAIKPLPSMPVQHAGLTLLTIAAFSAHGLRDWPPDQ